MCTSQVIILITVAQNLLKEIPEGMLASRDLDYVDISYNNLKKIPLPLTLERRRTYLFVLPTNLLSEKFTLRHQTKQIFYGS